MFTMLGNDALLISFLLALCAGVTGFLAHGTKTDFFLRATRLFSLSVFFFVSAAFGLLIMAYVQSDFSVLNVYQNSHTDKPLLYKIAGAWGNHEGSMILWTWVASLFAACLAFFGSPLSPQVMARILGTQALLILGFLAFIILTSNPFLELVPAPSQGLGLNPLLQDPALALHPPMLYLGYVGTSLAFSFAIAGLMQGDITRSWARALRPWVLTAWAALTLGIALGSWWAYYELGWGGWWFWDPVENASFVPWLSATALLHTLIVVEKRGSMKSWAVLLALITFTLSLIGTFLVRSGAITSVHAFALDPARGFFVLVLIGLTAGLGLLLFGLRAPRLEEESHFAPLSRETLLVLNNIFLLSGAATVLLGTIYPMLLEALRGAQISVGAPYFEATFVPLMIPLVGFMGLAPFVAWQKDQWRRLARAAAFPLGIAVTLVLIITSVMDYRAVRFLIGMGLSFWIALSSLRGWQQTGPRGSAMALAHLGVAIALFGMVASAHFTQEKTILAKEGDALDLAGYRLTFGTFERGKGPNYVYERAAIHIHAGGQDKGFLYPERRYYPAGEKLLSEVAIRSNGLSDLYVVLGSPQKDEKDRVKGYSLRAAHYPFIPWIWLGCLVMAAGGGVALVTGRKKEVSVRAGE